MSTNTLSLSEYASNAPVDITPEYYSSVYQELRRIAHRELRRAWSVDTISTTVLVNEAYLKLFNSRGKRSLDRAHFFAVAATAMRNIIISYAEQKNTQKRGAGWRPVPLDESSIEAQHNIETLLAVDKALIKLSSVDEKLALLVELRFFAGLTESEIASLFDQTERTVRRNWKKAKSLLLLTLNSAAQDGR